VVKKILLWLNKIFSWGWETPPKPRPDFVDNGVYITHEEFLEIVRTQLGDKLGKNVYIRHTDSEYYCPSVKYCKHLIATDKTDEEIYVPNLRDCDKFALLLKSAFVRDAWRTRTAREVAEMEHVVQAVDIGGGLFRVQRASHCFAIFDYVKTGGAHSVNCVVDDRLVLHIIEPQSDLWFSPQSDEIVKVLAIIP